MRFFMYLAFSIGIYKHARKAKCNYVLFFVTNYAITYTVLTQIK